MNGENVEGVIDADTLAEQGRAGASPGSMTMTIAVAISSQAVSPVLNSDISRSPS